MDSLKHAIQELFRKAKKQELPAGEPADFIIERYSSYYHAWGNSRVTYRIRRWSAEDKRYTFEGEGFWLENIYRKLRNDFKLYDPENTVPIVDIDK